MPDLSELSRGERLTWLLRDYLNKKAISQASANAHAAYIAAAKALVSAMMSAKTVTFYLVSDDPVGEQVQSVVFQTDKMSLTNNGFLLSPHQLNSWDNKPVYFNTASILRFASC